MKKIMYITMALALGFLMTAGPCIAGVAVAHDDNQAIDISVTDNPGCDVNLSKNVSLGYTRDSDDAAGAQTYAIQSYHTSGNKAYGTASDTTIIKWSQKTDKVDIAAPTVANSTEFSDWTAM